MLTEQTILRISAQARPDYVDALVGGKAEFEAANVNTPIRLALFLGQCAHETGGFTIMRELTTWRPEQMAKLWPHRFSGPLAQRKIKNCEGDQVRLACLAYSDRDDLGNMGGDDGWAYRGGNLLQGTGRAWYREAGNAIGVDLEGNPDLIEDGPIGLLTALYTWTRHGLNRYADRGYIRTCGNAINRGDPFASKDPIGHEGRISWTMRACQALGITLPDESELALGAYSAKVQNLQRLLMSKGYHLGAPDGLFGPETARQVAAAKLDFKRDVGGIVEAEEFVGPLAWAAFEQMPAVQVSNDRAMVGLSYKQQVAKMKERGSTEVKAASDMQLAGTGIAGLGLMTTGNEIGAIDGAKLYLSQVSTLKATMVPALDAFQWCLKHLPWVLLIVVGVWMYRGGGQVIAARIKAFVTRANLSK